jgi:hypothetical protein
MIVFAVNVPGSIGITEEAPTKNQGSPLGHAARFWYAAPIKSFKSSRFFAISSLCSK